MPGADRDEAAGGRPAVAEGLRSTGSVRPLKILTVTDEHTREALATPAARRMGADNTVNVSERIVEHRGRASKLIPL